VNASWRLFLAALGLVTQGGAPAAEDGGEAAPHEASRLVPVVGICIGLLAAVVYWVAAQVWPTSLAVVLSMLTMTLLTRVRGAPGGDLGGLYWVFVLFIKYNALMALSSADVPLPLPAYCGLGLIMIAAQAASRGLVVSVMATETPRVLRVTTGDLVIALGLGFAPAVLLGIPGLIALAAAIIMRPGLAGDVLVKFRHPPRDRLEIIQHLTELCFYLGALASWKYV